MTASSCCTLVIRSKAFAFEEVGHERTMHEVCDALRTHGISEQDALALLKEAEASFNDPSAPRREERTSRDMPAS
jgi:hypothetical protein